MTETPSRQRAPRKGRPIPPTATQDFVKKGLARFDLHDPYYFAVSLNWKHFTLLFLGAQLALNTIFATLFLLQPGAIANPPRHDFLNAFFFSLETLATVGYGEMYPGTTYGHVVAGIEIVVGMAFSAIMTGLLLIRFTKPKAKILYADNLVVAHHNGRPTLMLRLANGRRTMLNNADFSLHVLVRTISEEGVAHAFIAELPLLRSKIPIFAILFTMMHVIDETSPLAGYHAGHEEIADLRLFVSVQAFDPAIGQPVTDARAYQGGDIRFNKRYADAVFRDANDTVIADYAQLGILVDEPPQVGQMTRGGMI